ncbi:fimbrial protein [Janthinobacterium lividum]|uniref:fimbrial protein n=1 Tax=Janthinobacterium lividum TaxID=29581 RepID=UPI0014094538|nr:fimbrial protein [Janthinobacterium lividum]NHQ93880.1 type 1 fimbrial protein [Janthinobacterium lividum]
MNVGSLLKSGVAVAVLWAATGTAFAVTCTYINKRGVVKGTMYVSAAITVGRDVPVGTEVFRQKFAVTPGGAAQIECDGGPFERTVEFELGSSYSQANWPSGTYANKVYNTEIKGLGVVFKAYKGLLPRRDVNPSICVEKRKCVADLDTISDFEIIVIKIGDVVPGILSGRLLPTVRMFINFGSVKMQGLEIDMSGGVQVLSGTCSTPNVPVRMGTHLVSNFTEPNSATAWTDFSIFLTNCPPFRGTVNQTPAIWVSEGGTDSGGSAGDNNGSYDNNRLQYRIDPVRTAISPGTGVLSLEPTAAGKPSAASGIGVQVATKDGAPLPLATLQSSGLTLLDRASSYSIPLRARYLKTGNVVTGGAANASATFTISYE